MRAERTFLTAEWRDLAMLNYEVPADLLSPFVPSETELDYWNGKLFVSLVGFRFLKTRICGLSVPFHHNFDEVNLRFYVRRRSGAEIRRGVCFIREIVPRWAIAVIANSVYNEKYLACRMGHERKRNGPSAAFVEYRWCFRDAWNRLSVSAQGQPTLAPENSEEQFITEHFWGYSSQKDGATVEYRVDHPSWRVWRRCDANFEGDGTKLYGADLGRVLAGCPDSAFLAEGSAVRVFCGSKI